MGRSQANGFRLTNKQIKQRRTIKQAYELGLNNANKWHFQRFLKEIEKNEMV